MSMRQEYPLFNTWEWKSYDGSKIVNLDNFVKSTEQAEFFIGTDSQNYKKSKKVCVFTSVLVAYTRGRGGSVIVHTDKTPYMEHLRHRLFLEAMRSLETGWHINTLVSPERVVTIHLDVNASLKFESGRYKDELVGMVAAQGFNASCKPCSWAASSVADTRT